MEGGERMVINSLPEGPAHRLSSVEDGRTPTARHSWKRQAVRCQSFQFIKMPHKNWHRYPGKNSTLEIFARDFR